MTLLSAATSELHARHKQPTEGKEMQSIRGLGPKESSGHTTESVRRGIAQRSGSDAKLEGIHRHEDTRRSQQQP